MLHKCAGRVAARLGSRWQAIWLMAVWIWQIGMIHQALIWLLPLVAVERLPDMAGTAALVVLIPAKMAATLHLTI